MDPLDVLYNQHGIVVLNKPSGVAVHRGWCRDRVTVMSLLRDQLGLYVYPAHRLDRGSSGALVFTLTSELAREVQTAMSADYAAKNYLCLTRGIVPDKGIIDHALRKSKDHDKRPAQTAYQRLASFERYSLVSTSLLTGRVHQIRRHMKHISHPMIGDTKYGKGEHNRVFRERFDLHRLALHSYAVRFVNPVDGTPLQVRAPLPADLSVPLGKIGLSAAAEASIAAGSWLPNSDFPLHPTIDHSGAGRESTE